MSKGNTFENDLLGLIFNGTAIANLADDAATSPLTELYVSLHTADPGEAGDQTTNECAYTSYARVAVARTSSKSSMERKAKSGGCDLIIQMHPIAVNDRSICSSHYLATLLLRTTQGNRG